MSNATAAEAIKFGKTKRSRHSKAHVNVAINRAHKRNALELVALAKPNRYQRRAPLCEAHATVLAEKAAAREAAKVAAAEAAQVAQS
jgi:hypothetical protein